ncbi:glycosyltransferase family 4 protein [Candidatus Uhrbacteria bacterium]|nr:glycosyltransferase family 4 protein [Candidatus Uhrbacteria bacterium]
MFSREVRFYEELAARVGEVWFFTYGRNDHRYVDRLRGHIKIFPKQFPVPNLLYGTLLPFVYWRTLKHADVIRIHQVAGAIPALLTHWFFRKPLIVRAGYQWSLFHKQKYSRYSKRLMIEWIEAWVYRAARIVIVTTRAAADYIVRRYQIPGQKVHVIPNYVDSEHFRPFTDIKKENDRVCFVGRLSPEKNLTNLIESLQGTNIHLVLYGDGPLRMTLEQQAQRLGVHASFRGNIPNEQLPEALNTCELFVLPSLHEGNPKALLEAMACGLPVIGTNVEGIASLIEDGKTGVLCETNSSSIRQAITSLLADPAQRAKLGMTAHEFIVGYASLERAIQTEVSLYDI